MPTAAQDSQDGIARHARHEWDVIVIGAGSTGENVASRVVAAGLSAAVVEEELVGGDCSYWACMPSKALLRPAQALDLARRMAGAKQAVTGELDVEAVLGRRDGFASGWDDGSQVRWLEGASIDLLRGHARLAGPRRVEVAGPEGTVRVLTARHAVAVCVGSGPVLPPVPGLAEVGPWTSRQATSAKYVPRRLAVIGGGVVACEMATAWRSLGTEELTVVEMADRLLASYEPFVGDLVAEAFGQRGIDVRLATQAAAVHRPVADGPVTVELAGGATLTVDEVLVAVGRQAKTDDLGLDTVGLPTGGWLPVDDTLRVSGVDGGWLYAAGDVNGRALLTHMGKYQARAAADAIVARAGGDEGPDRAGRYSRYTGTADHDAVPQVVFTHPEVAAVGRTEAQAREAGLRVRTSEYDLGAVAGAALYADGYTGRAKIVVDQGRQVIVGATFLGPGAGELLHAATVAVVGEVPLDRLWHAVPSFPTISEVWLRLLETYGL